VTPPKVGYHGTPRAALDSVLRGGLLRDRTESYGCQNGGHVAIAETPEIAFAFGDMILVVDLDSLEALSEFYGGEARVHGDIAPERLSVYDGPEVVASLAGHIDPGWTPLGQHPACVEPARLVGFDFETYREGPHDWTKV
jgi:hypothetical protein